MHRSYEYAIFSSLSTTPVCIYNSQFFYKLLHKRIVVSVPFGSAKIVRRPHLRLSLHFVTEQQEMSEWSAAKAVLTAILYEQDFYTVFMLPYLFIECA